MSAESTAICPLGLTEDQLSAWRDRLLSAPEMTRIGAHVPTCTACRQHLAQFDAIARRLRGQHEIEPGNRFWHDVQARVTQSPGGRFPMNARMLWGGAGAVAVLLALVVAFTLVLNSRPGSSSSVITQSTRTPTALSTTTPTITPTATPTHPAGAVITDPIDTVSMVSASIGWAVVRAPAGTGNHQIAYTVDGGHTWYDVTPAGFIPEPPYGIEVYALSATEAWAWPGPTPGGNEVTKLWHTTDAGAHWTASTVPLGTVDQPVAVAQIDFIDSLNGWLAVTLSSYTGHTPIAVWHTTDGGASWKNVATQPIAGHTTGISFVNATTGFVASNYPLSDFLFSITHDAGQTWAAVSLPKPSDFSGAYTVEPPVFTDAANGVLFTTYVTSASQQKMAVYRTTDAGTTWTLSATQSVGATNNPTYTSVTATGEVFVAAVASTGSVALYDLLPGASSWTQINTSSGSVGLLTGMTKLDFVDANNGWALTQSGLIATTDGGVTWAVVHA